MNGIWRPGRTVSINCVFQGVSLPLDAQRVRLEFRPFARYAFGPHIFWLFLFAGLILRAWRSRPRKGALGAGTIGPNAFVSTFPMTGKELCIAEAHFSGILAGMARSPNDATPGSKGGWAASAQR